MHPPNLGTQSPNGPICHTAPATRSGCMKEASILSTLYILITYLIITQPQKCTKNIYLPQVGNDTLAVVRGQQFAYAIPELQGHPAPDVAAAGASPAHSGSTRPHAALASSGASYSVSHPSSFPPASFPSWRCNFSRCHRTALKQQSDIIKEQVMK